jgi:hypothetical protein
MAGLSRKDIIGSTIQGKNDDIWVHISDREGYAESHLNVTKLLQTIQDRGLEILEMQIAQERNRRRMSGAIG